MIARVLDDCNHGEQQGRFDGFVDVRLTGLFLESPNAVSTDTGGFRPLVCLVPQNLPWAVRGDQGIKIMEAIYLHDSGRFLIVTANVQCSATIVWWSFILRLTGVPETPRWQDMHIQGPAWHKF